MYLITIAVVTWRKIQFMTPHIFGNQTAASRIMNEIIQIQSPKFIRKLRKHYCVSEPRDVTARRSRSYHRLSQIRLMKAWR